MPYETVRVDPELFCTTHNGVNVFCTYKDDEIAQGRRRYWYTLHASDDDHAFDVREFDSAYHLDQHPPYLQTAKTPDDMKALKAAWDHWFDVEEPDHIRAIIEASIDAGLIPLPEDMADNTIEPGTADATDTVRLE
jgi:hypothetical protein